ncbi:putative membrane protein YjcC [compost metagenome]
MSLACIQKADIDFLKIDRSLVGELGGDGAGQGLCEAIIALAQRLGLKVVAEGVETASQRDLLRAAGCDYAQGYFFSRALPVGQMDRLLASQPAA